MFVSTCMYVSGYLSRAFYGFCQGCLYIAPAENFLKELESGCLADKKVSGLRKVEIVLYCYCTVFNSLL